MKKRRLSIAMLALAGILAGCGASENESKPPDSTEAIVSSVSTGESPAAETEGEVVETSIETIDETTVKSTEKSEEETTKEATEKTTEETTEESTRAAETTQADGEFVQTEKAILFSKASGFYTQSFTLKLSLKGQGKIYYTLDNTSPTDKSLVYGEGINLMSGNSDFPESYCVRAVAYLEDGTVTEEVAQTYMLDADIFDRFSTYVFCISGDPEDLTGKKGILTNSNKRGEEWERKIFVTAFDQNGKVLFEQYAGARVYGGASRKLALKSLKLFARKSYDADNGKFKYNLFNTEDYEGEYIDKYSKLVLRNTGNDMMFAYIRDEYLQILAKQAGYETYEGVAPTVGYLNGKYYCFYWLHENYCDTYFKKKFGDGDGEFVVLEGGDLYKKSDDPEDKLCVDEYEALYEKFRDLDYTDDKNYEELLKVIDVENYLDYFAYNIYVANTDWPNNNYKCYRYYPAEGEEEKDGVFDGRWRYLLHDTDYSLGLYDQMEPRANFDTLNGIMSESCIRYAALFTSLLKREECKVYYVNKTLELMNGAFSTKNMLKVLDETDKLRSKEMTYYYKYMENLRYMGNDDIWTRASHLKQYMKQITDFITARPEYMIKYLQTDLNVVIEKTENVYTLVQGEK